LHLSIIMKFKSRFCSDSKLIYAKKIIEKMNTLICTFHFQLHNSTAHLSNLLKLSRSFETQWNLLCWKYKINDFYFGYTRVGENFFFCLTLGQTGTGVLSDPWPLCLSHHFFVILYITCQNLFFYTELNARLSIVMIIKQLN
jgi:hypothetical protein